MSNDVLEYPSNGRIEAKITYAPGDAVPAGFIFVRDADNTVRRKIELTPDNIDQWIDVTQDVVPIARGIVEAQLIRTVGNGPWQAALHLRATENGETSTAQDTERRKFNYVDPSVLFRRKV